MLTNLISIEVTPDIAAKLRFLAESGVFAIKTGNATLNFHEGELKTIKIELYTYSTQQKIDNDTLTHVKLMV